MKKILSLASVLAVALFVSTACQQKTSTTANNKAANTTTVQPPTDSHGHTDDAPRIQLADAKADFDAGNALFVDTRPTQTYETEHIKGSINVMVGDVESKISQLKTDKKIIAYCS